MNRKIEMSSMFGNGTMEEFFFNGTNNPFLNGLREMSYDRYVFFAVFSALVGLPSNILLLVILMRIGLFNRRQSALNYLNSQPTGSFERFLFEIVIIDTLLIIYHFVDNFLSYIHEDRSAGQHYLIHVSDFCCKFFTYIAKMSVLLTTWLLLFLIINRLILTMDYNHNSRSIWNRGLYYVNAKYSTVFLVFIFSVYNIYPIEVLKYRKKDEVPDFEQERLAGVCSIILDEKSRRLLNATNYVYNLLGMTLPCLFILAISMLIIFRTCRNTKYTNKESHSFHYIAAMIGILHSLFNLPSRLTDILLMFGPGYARFVPDLLYFNHEAQSFISLSYAYKCFVCILISREFRHHAKNVLCFLIENQYDDRHPPDLTTNSNRQNFSSKNKRKHRKHRRHHPGKEFYLRNLSIDGKLPDKKLSFSHINKDDYRQLTTSEATYWIRPYFTQLERRHPLRPCGHSASCHQLSDPLIPFDESSKKLDCPSTITGTSALPVNLDSFPMTSLISSNDQQIHLPLPQKHARDHQCSSESTIPTPYFSNFTSNRAEQTAILRTDFNHLSLSHLY